MSTADWVVIGVVAVAGLYGVANGLLRGAFSLAGFALGAYLGARLAPALLSDGSPYAPVVALGGAILGGMLLRGGRGLLAGVLRTSLGVVPACASLDSLGGLLLGLPPACPLLGRRRRAPVPPGQPDLRRSVQKSAILSRDQRRVPPSACSRRWSASIRSASSSARRPSFRLPTFGLARDPGRGGGLEERRPRHRDRLRARHRGLRLDRAAVGSW